MALRKVLIGIGIVGALGGAVIGGLVLRDKLRNRRTTRLYMPVLEAANAKDKERKEAIRSALNGTVVARPDLGRCPESVVTGALNAIAYSETNNAGAWWHDYLGKLEPMSRRDELDPAEWNEAVRRIDSWDREVDLIADVAAFAEQDYNRRAGVVAFKPGELSGRVYLYSFREHRIVCAGAFQTENDRTFAVNRTVNRRTGEVVSDDFRRQADEQLTSAAKTEAIASLVVAGPPR